MPNSESSFSGFGSDEDSDAPPVHQVPQYINCQHCNIKLIERNVAGHEKWCTLRNRKKPFQHKCEFCEKRFIYLKPYQNHVCLFNPKAKAASSSKSAASASAKSFDQFKAENILEFSSKSGKRRSAKLAIGKFSELDIDDVKTEDIVGSSEEEFKVDGDSSSSDAISSGVDERSSNDGSGSGFDFEDDELEPRRDDRIRRSRARQNLGESSDTGMGSGFQVFYRTVFDLFLPKLNELRGCDLHKAYLTFTKHNRCNASEWFPPRWLLTSPILESDILFAATEVEEIRHYFSLLPYSMSLEFDGLKQKVNFLQSVKYSRGSLTYTGGVTTFCIALTKLFEKKNICALHSHYDLELNPIFPLEANLKSLVQLYSIDSRAISEFVGGVALNHHGPVWCAVWCPVPNLTSHSLLGTLLVSSLFGGVQLYSIPTRVITEKLVVNLSPILTLVPPRSDKKNIIASVLSWNNFAPFDFVAVGYTNGCVQFFHIRSTSTLLLESSTNELKPIKSIFCSQAPIKSISWSSANQALIFTSETSIFYDITTNVRVAQRHPSHFMLRTFFPPLNQFVGGGCFRLDTSIKTSTLVTKMVSDYYVQSLSNRKVHHLLRNIHLCPVLDFVMSIGVDDCGLYSCDDGGNIMYKSIYSKNVQDCKCLLKTRATHLCKKTDYESCLRNCSLKFSNKIHFDLSNPQVQYDPFPCGAIFQLSILYYDNLKLLCAVGQNGLINLLKIK